MVLTINNIDIRRQFLMFAPENVFCPPQHEVNTIGVRELHSVVSDLSDALNQEFNLVRFVKLIRGTYNMNLLHAVVYAKYLIGKELPEGWTVRVINTPEMKEMIEETNACRPDLFSNGINAKLYTEVN